MKVGYHWGKHIYPGSDNKSHSVSYIVLSGRSFIFYFPDYLQFLQMMSRGSIYFLFHSVQPVFEVLPSLF